MYCHNNHVTQIRNKKNACSLHLLFFFLTPNSCDTFLCDTFVFFTHCHRLSQQSCHKNWGKNRFMLSSPFVFFSPQIVVTPSFVTPSFFSHMVTDCHNNHVTKILCKKDACSLHLLFFFHPQICVTPSFVTPLCFTNCHRLSQQ